jgi:hypothetical protein
VLHVFEAKRSREHERQLAMPGKKKKLNLIIDGAKIVFKNHPELDIPIWLYGSSQTRVVLGVHPGDSQIT